MFMLQSGITTHDSITDAFSLKGAFRYNQYLIFAGTTSGCNSVALRGAG